MARRTKEEFLEARSLLGTGFGIRHTARELGLPYSMVRYWSRLRSPPGTLVRRLSAWEDPPDPTAYCYLLGLYLGDGCIGETGPTSLQLSLTLDRRYPMIVDEAEAAIRLTVPDAHVGRYLAPGAIRIYVSYSGWRDVFPQHGPGRKHTRLIELMDWQEDLTQHHPEALLRGLIHSDGSRSINRFRTKLPSGRVAQYEYVRYFFTNYSADIRGIFCEHCDLLGIHWTQSSFKNISVAHRDSVAILDSFVGPKR